MPQGSDSDLTDLFLSKTTASNFFRDYNQLMPVSSSAILLSLASGEGEITRALSDNRPLAEPGETTGWTEEINYYADHSSNSEGMGFTHPRHRRGQRVGAWHAVRRLRRVGCPSPPAT